MNTSCALRIGMVAVALALAACSDGSGRGSAPAPLSVRGAVVKGPVQSAQVQLFALDDGGFATGIALQTLTTDATGRFTFSRPGDGPALLAVTRGGSFVDESDPQTDPERKRRVTLTGEQGFESVLPAGATTLVVTPYTESLLLRARRAANGANFLAFFDAVRARAIAAFGLDPFATIPESPLAPNPAASIEARQYALLLGGAALAMQTQAAALGTLPTFFTIRAFIEDLSDGRLDGLLAGEPVPVLGHPQPLPSGVSLADAVLRFRNNNFAAYTGVDPSSIDENRLAAELDLVNQPPLARDDLFSTAEDVALVVAAPGVLGNDIDSENQALSAELLSGPANGTLILAPGGGFTYTPATDFNGTDSFTYRASDGDEDSNTATVTLTVGGLNDPPLAVGDSYSSLEDTVLEVPAPGVLDNDSDPERQSLTALLVSPPANGTLSLMPDGSFAYTPDENFDGEDSFTYQASDGTAQSPVVTVSLIVDAANDPPSASDDLFSVVEDVARVVAAPGVLGNDIDSENDVLSAELLSGADNGTLVLNPGGGFTYTPDAEFNGIDSFTYRASDGSAGSEAATVTLTVGERNDAPLAAGDSFSTEEDTPLEVPAPGVLRNDSDPEDSALTALLVAEPARGELVLNPNGSFTYTPDANFSGADSFSYQASDGAAQSGVVTVSLTVNAGNDPPLAAGDTYSTTEGAALQIGPPGVLGNDTDSDGDALTAVLVAGPANGTLSLNSNGSVTYTPAANFSGGDSFTYRASDGPAQSGVVTVSLTVSGVNDPPLAAGDRFSTNEDTALDVPAPGVLANDSDVEDTPLTAVLVAGPANGSLSLNRNGSFRYTPNTNFNGADAFTYQASDGTAQSGIVTVTLTVNDVNDPPLAAGDNFLTNEGTPLNVAAPGVLGNDSDLDGNALTASRVAGPANGTLSLNPNGSFTYTPNANFNGSDSFTYRASDGTVQSNVATVSLIVNAVNDPPVAGNNSFSTNEGTALNVPAPGVLGNDSDVEDTALTAVLVAGPANGELGLNPNGSFTYTPNANFNGADAFTYRASDGTLQSNLATVSLTVNAVNDPPLAVNDSFSTAEETVLNVSARGVLVNDSDPDGTEPTAVLVAGPANGTLSLNPNGSFMYTPNANFNGSDSFTYRASDGTAQSNLATVSLTVGAENDPPLAVNDSFSTDEDTALNAPAPGVLGNDSDPEDSALTATLVAGPANGMLSLNPNGSFTYTPDENFSGGDSFTYQASDGTAQSNVATVSLTVNAVNDSPLAVDDSFSTAEETVLNAAVPGVLVNDTDPDGDPLTAVMVAGPANGSLNLFANGRFTYTPEPNFSGSDSFTYRASDGTEQSNLATVSLTVGAENDPPLAVNDSFSTTEETPLNVPAPGVLDNDSDPEGTTLTTVLVAGPENGTLNLDSDGSFTYTPDENFSGGDSFTYQASDGTAQSNVATVSLTVNAANDPPLAVNDSFSTAEETELDVSAPGVLANDSDVEGTPLTAILVAGPVEGSLSLMPNGRFTYTPGANFSGADSFTYRASDGSEQSNLATVSITVSAENDPPVAGDNSFSTNEDMPLTVPAPGVLGNDSDPDGDAITAVLVAGPTKGTLNLLANGGFTYTPNANSNGADSFTYQASDGTAQSEPATVSLTVSAVNDVPVAGNDSFSTAEEMLLTVPAPGVLANDSDADGTPLTAVLVTAPVSGSFSLMSNGGFMYTPNDGFSGSDSFTYQASDGTAQSNIATVSLTVSSVNDSPTAVNDSFSTNEDMPLTVSATGVLANDSDPEGDSLTAVLVAAPASGMLTLNPNGSFSYTPSANFSGSVSFTYRASDGSAMSNLATVSLTVTAVNDPPETLSDSFTFDEDTVLNVPAPGLLANDSDPEGSPLTAVLVAGPLPSQGVLVLNSNGDGGFTFTPRANLNGMVTFIYRASDGTAQSGNTLVILNVTAVNDPPMALSNSFSTAEDTLLTVDAPGVLGNDFDPEGSVLTAIMVAGPTQGTLVLNSNGGFTYTPNANINGTDSFTYRAIDTAGAQSIPATVTITVNAVNDAPVAVNDLHLKSENSTLVVFAPGVLANDTDVDGPALTAVLVTGPATGSVVLRPDDGSFTFTPTPGNNNSTSFTYRVSDGSLNSNDATVTITVIAAPNGPPVANPDNFATTPGVTLLVPAPGLLANDTDPDGDPLAALLEPGGGPDGFGSLLFQDTFDGEPGRASPALSLINWNITAGTVDLALPSRFDLPGGGLLLDLDGTAPPTGAGTIQTKQTFNLPEGNYLLSFRASNNDEAPGNPNNSMTVSVAGQSQNFTTAMGAIFAGTLQEYSFQFGVPATTSTRIVFAHAGADGAGIIIDDVRLIRLNVLPADGSFVYVPVACVDAGVYPSSFTYRATDGALQSTPATVTITVTSQGCD